MIVEECVFPVIHTSDGCLVMAVSTPSGEVLKFDSNFNHLWSSNALSLDRIGIGKHPLIELDNGDILYCATVHEQPQHLALVRIDSNGNYVGNMDYTEPVPPSFRISAYPNPFSSEVTIKTEGLPVTDSKLLFYNIRGQLVDTIELRDNRVNWTPGNIPSGIYILNLVGDGGVLASRKISYIKQEEL